jgi:hypothetical protein
VSAFSYLAMGRYPTLDAPLPSKVDKHPENNMTVRILAKKQA